MGFIGTVAKWLLILFNFLFILVGIALLAVGLYVIFSPYSLEILAVLDSAIISSGAYFIIALGGVVFVIAAFGVCGACCKSRILLALYILIVFVIIVSQLAMCAVVVAYRGQVDAFVTDTLATTMDDYEGETEEDKYSVGWNAMQIFLECCGTDNYTDWMDTPWINSTDKTVPTAQYPISCCAVEDNTAVITQSSVGNSTFLNVTGCYGLNGETIPNAAMAGMGEGCYQAFQDYVITNSLLIGIVGLGLVLFEVLLFFFAIIACCTVEDDEKIS